MLISPEAACAEAEPWADARTRALAACLMDVLLARPETLGGLAACLRDSDATCWAEQFAAVSYGDPFFGACVSLALLPCMPPDVQVTPCPPAVNLFLCLWCSSCSLNVSCVSNGTASN